MFKTGRTLTDFPTLKISDVLSRAKVISIQDDIERDIKMMAAMRKRYGLSDEVYDEATVNECLENLGGEVPVVITQFGQWIITTTAIEAADKSYYIPRDSINNTDWITHMSEKNWVNLEEFIRAYYHASRIYQALDAIENK